VPELALAGYPPEDLLLKPGFVADNLRKLDELIAASRDLPGLTTIIGFVDRDHDIYNAAAVIAEGTLAGVYHKHYLPNYGVFNEQGALVARAKEFEEDMLIVDLDTASVFRSRLHDTRRRQERLQVKPDEVPVIDVVNTSYAHLQHIQANDVVLGAPQRIEPKM